MSLTTNQAVLSWIDEMAAVTGPDQVVWISGEESQPETPEASINRGYRTDR